MKSLAILAIVCGTAVVPGLKADGVTADSSSANSALGAVFAATNDVKNNEVVMYSRSASGALKLIGSFATGGRGEGGINGTPTNPVISNEQGVEPFGASFTPSGALHVTEAQSGAVSSYAINPDNSLSVVTSKAAAGGGATCWVISVGKYAYASNSLSSDLALYALVSSGSLTTIGVTAKESTTLKAIFPPGVPITSYPLDLAATPDKKFIYVVHSVLGKVIGYQVQADGTLLKIASVSPYAPQIRVEGLAAVYAINNASKRVGFHAAGTVVF